MKLECPSCAVTMRLSLELFARRIAGRCVKTTCKVCRTQLFIDATGGEPQVSREAPAAVVARRLSSLPPRSATSDLATPHAGERAGTPLRRSSPPPAPDRLLAQGFPPPPRVPDVRVESMNVPARTRLLLEEELPTRPQNSRPFFEGQATSIFYEAPPTSRTLALPVRATPDVLEALSVRKPSRGRKVLASAALFAAGAAAFAVWSSVSDWREDSAGRRSTSVVTPSPVAVAHASHEAERRASVAAAPVTGLSSSEGAVAEKPGVERVSIGGDVALPSATKSTRPEARLAAARPPGEVSSEVSRASAEGTTKPASHVEGRVSEVKVASSGGPALGSPSEGAGSVASEGQDAAAPASFDTTAAVTALQVLALQAGSCRKAGDPSGMARVLVTFAPSGRVTSSTVAGPPFSGTATGGCIASQFRAARVPAFSGPFVTVAKTVVVQ